MYPFFAYRNLTRRSRRYIFIFSAMALSFAVITIITGISNGAMVALQDKAARYFAGHISITGFLPGQIQSINNTDELLTRLTESSLPLRTISPRTIYYRGDAQLFFEGERVIQRRLIGIDVDKEQAEFATMDISSGSLASLNNPESPGIAISQSAAKILRCKVGDMITLYLSTYDGQPNSINLVVHAIFNETSLFGFVAYMDRHILNILIKKESDFSTDIALYVHNGINLNKLVNRLHSYLTNLNYKTVLFSSREERDAKLSSVVKKDPVFVILAQNAQLAQIRQFITAFLGITYFILVIFLLITMTGVINTYRVLIHERKKEIGVLRALGMQKSGVVSLFLMESVELSFFASLVGFVIGSAVLFVVSFFNLSFIPGSGLVLEQGHLRISFSVSLMLLNMFLLICATMLAVLRPALHASHVSPVLAMRGGA
ncbi:ABC transporter permease [Gracilinema caldarium]|uniref:ABC transporter permease n=1 Tax=Gracilinema caldarium TaxID=215591 RepID=UPI0026EF37AF|nr:FtsX-like permease family protein [Gracilinema caldarium]